jgi:glycogen operon protein
LPSASINYVVSHDGFTLRDLVSYVDKHNEANGEHNRDGTSNNLSVNCGVEGETSDPGVLAMRGRLQRALLATTLLAQGIPMLSAGDEIGHTQGGNNNPYCQDNETTWIDWARADADLLAFTARTIALRRDTLPLLDTWVDTLPADAALVWTGGDDQPLDEKAWNDTGHRAFGCLIPKPGRPGAPLKLLFNASSHDLQFVLPPGRWNALLDSADPRGETQWQGDASTPFPLRSRSVVVLRQTG